MRITMREILRSILINPFLMRVALVFCRMVAR